MSHRYHYLLGIISVSCVIEFLQSLHAQRYLQSLHLLLAFVEWSSGPRRTRGFFSWFFSPCTILPAAFLSYSFAVWQREIFSLLPWNTQKEFTAPLKYGQPALQLWGQKLLFLNFDMTDSCLPETPGLTLWATLRLWANLNKTGWRAMLLMPPSAVWGLWCDNKLNRAASHFVLCSCIWAQWRGQCNLSLMLGHIFEL